MLYWVTLGCFVAMATASICPFEEHQICNADDDDHKCLCALAGGEESPPEISCNQLIVRDEEGNFPVISVTFSLSDASDGLDEWPEDDFVEAIGRSLSVQKSDILILRATCQEDEKFTVQFGILKKGTNSSDIPYESDDFFPTNSLATRLKPMGHLQKIGDLEVESIEENRIMIVTEELTDIPTDVDNTDLIIKASLVGAFFLLTFILGIWVSCRNRGYSDDLQKP